MNSDVILNKRANGSMTDAFCNNQQQVITKQTSIVNAMTLIQLL